MAELEGRVALVTGGGRGIGRAAALDLARRGARVAILSRTEADVRAVAQEIAQLSGQALALACDVSRYDSLEAAFFEIRDNFGRLDILVNNAAIIGPFGLTAGIDPNDWALTIDVNLLGAFYAARLALPGMIERGWGRIVNVSSGAAQGSGFPRGSAYSVSKAGLDMLTRALAAELAGSGVAVVSVYPGVVDTEMQAQIRAAPAGKLDDATAQRFRGYYESGQLLDPAIPGALIAALCGEAGARYSGQILRVSDEAAQALIKSL